MAEKRDSIPQYDKQSLRHLKTVVFVRLCKILENAIMCNFRNSVVHFYVHVIVLTLRRLQ